MNGLEKELDGKAQLVRVNLFTAAGKQIARRFDVKSAATLVVLSGKGDVVYRHTGMPNKQKVVDAVNGVQSHA